MNANMRATKPSASNILVTGGAGYIGSHTCKALFENGWTPIAYDNLSRGNRWAVRWGELIEGDITDSDKLDLIVRQYRPIGVIHFAGYAYVGESVEHPSMYYKNNTLGTLCLADICIKNKIKNFIFSSSCSTYGIPKILPISEQTTQHPINPYGFSKLFSEQMLSDIGQIHELNTVVLRYFNACGADESAEIGEAHDPEPHIIPRALGVAMNDRLTFDIYGTDYDTLDGSAVRDYIHVSDLAEAHVKALNYLLQCNQTGGVYQAINVGTGKGYSVIQIIKEVERMAGKAMKIRKMPRRPGDPSSLIAQIEKAKALLNFEPTRSSLDNIIRTAYSWHQKKFSHENL